ncbi:MAG TPA: ribonuclease H-like domain-containing protein [Syntrophorhabdaceae bacterium]|jgi:hypothetical protein
MSLKGRLGRLIGEKDGPSNAGTEPEQTHGFREKIESVMARRERIAPTGTAGAVRRTKSLDAVIAGEEAGTSAGTFFLSRAALTGDDRHGHCRICDLAHTSMGAAAFLSGHKTLKDCSIEGGLFLDTETTGLAGGTGTFPFLIGLGWLEQGSFMTCQLFARDFSEEKAMLTYLGELASTKDFLVTFNGKTFDLNLLSTRFILSRCQDTLSALPHIDLLHPSRRMFSHRLENARLATIEADLLGVRRNGDVPGFEIPQRYFDWLRSHDARPLEDVFTHNRLDVVSMATLLKYLTDLVEGCEDIDRGHHGDLLKLAALIHERGDLEKAGRIFEALVLSRNSEVASGARRSLSLVHKKARRREEAVKLWQHLLAENPRDPFPALELAKHYEHHTREIEKALEIVQDLLGKAARLSNAERALLEHRLRRLRHKVSSDSD